jgi:hypothetical protein
MRRAARKDDNQQEIVDALRAAGCPVEVLSQEGLPDLLVGRGFRFHLLEVKDGAKPPSAQQLTPAQVKFFEKWEGYPRFKVNSVDEALRAVGIQTRKASQ